MWYIVVQHPPSLKKTRNQKQAKEKRTSPIKTVSTWRSLWNEFYKNSFLHDVVLNLIEGSLGSRCDRRGPHSIVAGNVSSDSIPGVLGIVSPVKSTFGGWLVGWVRRCDFKLVHHCAVSISWLCFRSPDWAMITANWSHHCFDHAGPWRGLFFYLPMDPWLRPTCGGGGVWGTLFPILWTL